MVKKIKETPCQRCGCNITYKTNKPNHCKICRPIFKKEYIKQWEKKNPDKLKKRQDRFKKNNPEKIKEYFKKYSKSEKGIRARKRRQHLPKYVEYAKYCSSLRRSRLRKIIHKFTYKDWLLMRKKTKGICPLCGKNVGLEKISLDHIYPISKADEGRIYTIDDVQPLCIRCNTKKNDKVIKNEIF